MTDDSFLQVIFGPVQIVRGLPDADDGNAGSDGRGNASPQAADIAFAGRAHKSAARGKIKPGLFAETSRRPCPPQIGAQ
jgi:hypothetical protein